MKKSPRPPIPSFRSLFFRRWQCFAVLIAFLVNSFGFLPLTQADEFKLPVPGVMVQVSPEFNPPILKGIKVHPDDPFQFDFILDQGDSNFVIPAKAGIQNQEQLKIESTKLIKYFLASLTVPEKDLWVNLSPYEKNRIVPQSFGQTEMGRDLLAEDYMLKQITASLIYPEDAIGKKFWKRIYEEASKKFGTTNIPVNTFNKVWIIPEKAVVYENVKAGTAYVIESKLKVMLEQDYLALTKYQTPTQTPTRGHVPEGYVSPSRLPSNEALNVKAPQGNAPTTNEDVNALGSQIVREIVIPELSKEVNEGKNFSQLRQVYNSLILATWYKKKIRDSILEQVYADKNKIKGLSSPNVLVGDPTKGDVEAIYQRYLQAFKKGVYNYIKEDVDPTTQETVPRKYFSGGTDLALTATFKTVERVDPALLNSGRQLTIVSSKFNAVKRSVVHRVIKLIDPGRKTELTTHSLRNRWVDEYLKEFIEDHKGSIPLKTFVEIGLGENAPTFFEWHKTLRTMQAERSVDPNFILIGIDNQNSVLADAQEKITKEGMGHVTLESKGSFSRLIDVVGKYGHVSMVRALNVFVHYSLAERKFFRQRVEKALDEGGIFVENNRGGMIFIHQKIKGKLTLIQIIAGRSLFKEKFLINAFPTRLSEAMGTMGGLSGSDYLGYLKYIESLVSTKETFVSGITERINSLGSFLVISLKTDNTAQLATASGPDDLAMKAKGVVDNSSKSFVPDSNAQSLMDLWSRNIKKLNDFYNVRFSEDREFLQDWYDNIVSGVNILMSNLKYDKFDKNELEKLFYNLDLLLKGINVFAKDGGYQDFSRNNRKSADKWAEQFLKDYSKMKKSDKDKYYVVWRLAGYILEGRFKRSDRIIAKAQELLGPGPESVKAPIDQMQEIIQAMIKDLAMNSDRGINIESSFYELNKKLQGLSTYGFISPEVFKFIDHVVLIDLPSEVHFKDGSLRKINNLAIDPKSQSVKFMPNNLKSSAEVFSLTQINYFDFSFSPQVKQLLSMNLSVYPDSNEENLGSIDRFNDSNLGEVYMGFSGWFNYKLMFKRKVKYAFLLDKNLPVILMHRLTAEIIHQSKDRFDFVKRFEKALQNSPVRIGMEGDWSELKFMTQEKESWLNSDDNFLFIKQMFEHNRIISSMADVRLNDVFNRIAEWLDENNLRMDAIYVSNLLAWLASDVEGPRKYYDNLSKVSSPSTIIVDASRQERSGRYPLIQRARVASVIPEIRFRIGDVAMNALEEKPIIFHGKVTIPEADVLSTAYKQIGLPITVEYGKRNIIPVDPYLQRVFPRYRSYNILINKVLNELIDNATHRSTQKQGKKSTVTVTSSKYRTPAGDEILKIVIDQPFIDQDDWSILKQTSQMDLSRLDEPGYMNGLYKNMNGAFRFFAGFSKIFSIPTRLEYERHSNPEGGMLTKFYIKFTNVPQGGDLALLTGLKGMPASLEEPKRGGIDLTPANMNLQTKIDSSPAALNDKAMGAQNDGGIKFHLDPGQLEQLQNAAGFVPVIINMRPMLDLKSFLDSK